MIDFIIFIFHILYWFLLWFHSQNWISILTSYCYVLGIRNPFRLKYCFFVRAQSWAPARARLRPYRSMRMPMPTAGVPFTMVALLLVSTSMVPPVVASPALPLRFLRTTPDRGTVVVIHPAYHLISVSNHCSFEIKFEIKLQIRIIFGTFIRDWNQVSTTVLMI